MQQTTGTTYFKDTRPHYKLLDGLRGVAALMVVWYHVFEGFGFAGAVNGVSDGSITTFNHGYLAVDFFFMLSGFVISYAYDGRWGSGRGCSGSGTSGCCSPAGSLTLAGFIRRRLIRLHPMVIMGAIIGAISFCIAGGTNWIGEAISWQNIALALVLGMLLIPAWPGARFDVRGNGEMYPLNGPSWSLFFEYIGNILYALLIRKLSTKWLKCLTATLGVCFAIFAITNTSGYGSIGVGWTLDCTNFFGGLVRMLFPFTLGMLIRRTLFNRLAAQQATHHSNTTSSAAAHSLADKHAFAICSALLFVIFSVPFLGAGEHFSPNGIYETLCIAVIFPAITILAASSTGGGDGCSSNSVGAITKYLGDLSYPLYIVHYPVMYLFYKWLINTGHYTLGSCWPAVILVLCTSLALATLCLKLYDEPVRKWLSKTLRKNL